MELVSPASVSKEVKQQPQFWSRDKCMTAMAKPLFEIQDSNNVSGMDESDNVPDSWEDIEDLEFPPVKSSATVAANSDSCCDGTADDWFNVKPGQLESTKWSMTFSRQTVKPRVQSASFSDPVAPQSNSSNKKKKRSFNLFRPDMDNSNESTVDWSQRFKTRYEVVTTPYYDSHCHLDFLFKRTGFVGSFVKYRHCNANTFPASFAGCIAVFCNPKMWAYKSEGKICILLFYLYVV